MIILGIDPGTATTGFGVIESTKDKNQPKLVDFGVIATSSKLSDAERLLILAEDLQQLIKKYKPQAVGVEKLFFTTNQKTAMSVSQARGVALMIAERLKIKIFEFTPLQMKSFISGYGKASKAQVQYIVQKTFKLKKPPRPDDAADAIALAMCALHHHGKNLSTRH